MQSDETFHPKTIEDQIDQLTAPSQSTDQSPNARVVHSLSAHYEEEMRSTERVWERLSHTMSKDGTTTGTQTVRKPGGILDKVPDAPLQQKKLESRFPRYTPPSRFALVAAALFAALLVSSLLWVLQMAHSTQVGHGSQTAKSSHGIYFSTSDGLSKLDVQSGKLLWHTLNLNRGYYNTLYAPVILGNVVYNVEGSHILVALNAGDGTVRWSRVFNTTTVLDRCSSMPLEGHSTLRACPARLHN